MSTTIRSEQERSQARTKYSPGSPRSERKTNPQRHLIPNRKLVYPVRHRPTIQHQSSEEAQDKQNHGFSLSFDVAHWGISVTNPKQNHQKNSKIQRGGPIGAGYPEGASFAAAEADEEAMALAEGADVGGKTSAVSFPPPSALRADASYLGVTSPPFVWPLTMPRPGIIGVFKEVVDALPLAPKGNLVSKVPERELEEVFGRLAEVPKEPQPCPWLL